MTRADDRALIEPDDPIAWRAWLERNHASSEGVWLAIAKKGASRGLPYEQAIEHALAFGWIDSKAMRMDDERYKLMFTPRKRRSGWSKSNRERVERLLAEGRMQPAGLAAVEAAKADGSWTKLDE